MNIVDQQTFRDAMSCMGAAVNIITTDGPAGRAGFTASAVCSVTDTPPTLLVCLNRGASVWPVFNENRTLCVNTLSARAGVAFKPFWRQNAHGTPLCRRPLADWCDRMPATGRGTGFV